MLVSLVPQLGLIIDLTNTTKYYNPDEFIQLGVRYQKIQVQGQKVPSYNCSEQFRRTVNAFLEENKDNGKYRIEFSINHSIESMVLSMIMDIVLFVAIVFFR